MELSEPLTELEEKLREKVRIGEPCSFLDDGDGDGDEVDKTTWGEERLVRAVVLKAMLTDAAKAWGIGAGAALDLRGAVVSGDLTEFEGNHLPPIRFDFCRFDDDVDFSKATFTGDACFRGATFNGKAAFGDATFTRDAVFDKATFTRDAVFGKATFTHDASFKKTTFEGHAAFGDATFIGDALFGDALSREKVAIFKGNAGFDRATFIGTAIFSQVTFEGNAWFDGTSCAGNIWFTKATFNTDAVFSEATFTEVIGFLQARFLGVVDFTNTLADEMRFTSAVFSAPEPGPWIASKVLLDQAVLTVRSRIPITAMDINASGLLAREGAHLILYCPKVDLTDSEFLRRSIVSSPAVAHEIPDRWTPDPPAGDSPTDKAQVKAATAVKELRKRLIREFADSQTSPMAPNQEEHHADEAVHSTPQCHVISLKRANIGELVLSDVVLDDCEFVGALGLDRLRVGPGCSFRRTPPWWGRRRMARRRIIAEELTWRQAHDGRPKERDNALDFLPAPDVAEIYRDLRKGLEEGKNEPGAADFYYGEMEMRRLAGREPAFGSTARRRSPPSWAERALLNLYWAVSGYGLRASRSVIALAALLTTTALLYTCPAFANVTPPPTQITKGDLRTGLVTNTPPPLVEAPNIWAALEYSARESISLLQTRTGSELTPKGPGTLIDFILRLAGPVLLAFTILALRARIRR